MSSLAPINLPGITPIEAPTAAKAERVDLGDTFASALSDARALENSSTASAKAFGAGDPAIGIHEVMIASEKANIALKFVTTLKNKALEAYRELMATQV